MTINKDDLRNLSHWFAIAILVVAIVILGLSVYGDVNPDDPYGLLRSLILRSTTMMIGGLWLMLQVSALDILIPGNNLKDMSDKPHSMAMVYSAYIIALAIIFAYS